LKFIIMGKRQKQTRIDVSATSAPAGLQTDAFAVLDGLTLPEGPACSPPSPSSEAEAASAREAQAPPAGPRGRVVLRRETAHRGGKTVVVVSGFDDAMTPQTLDELARAVRKACGCGGTVRGREIEVQGDQPARVAAFFRAQGFRVGGVVE
jgi:translation initiation factor 1